MKKISIAYFSLPLMLLLSLLLSACGDTNTNTSGPVTVHLGYFPNITHAVALVGVARGTFAQSFGKNVTLDTKQFNAGPALVEAMFADSIDIGYVGPNPAINGYIQSKGQALRIIAGASSGGALFIVRPGAHITTARDLAGKKIASPQLGGTQDISLRNYIVKNGLQTTDKGGTVQIIPLANADTLTEFKAGQIDGAWVPEPWASRLVQEDQGTILVDERSLWPNGQFVTTNVIVSKKFLDQHPDLVTKFLEAHVDTVEYINANLANAKTLVNSQLKLLTQKALAPAVVNSSFNNLEITYDPLAQSLFTAANAAYNLGYLKAKPDQGIYDLAPLNTVLKAKGLPQVAA